MFNAVVRDDKILCVSGFEVGSSNRSGEVVYIGPLCVHESYRNQGIGSIVINAYKIMATQMNYKLLLYAHKDVQWFYEKHGFKAVYEVEEDYQAMEWMQDNKG